MTFYSRSDWLGKGHTAPRLKRTQTEIYIHWPGKERIGIESVSATMSRLRGYWSYHVHTQGWSDIAYNYAVDQSGNVYSLRGRNRQCGGNGGTVTNRRGQAILALLGEGEQPTDDCVNGIRWTIAHIQEPHPSADEMLGHKDSFEASSTCPGPILYQMVHDGVFYGTKSGGPVDVVEEDAGGHPQIFADVDWTQASLNELGAGLEVDGIWGAATEAAVEDYQETYMGVAEGDGRPGPNTRAALGDTMSKLDRLEAIVTENQQRIGHGNDISAENQRRIDALPDKTWRQPIQLSTGEYTTLEALAYAVANGEWAANAALQTGSAVKDAALAQGVDADTADKIVGEVVDRLNALTVTES